MPLPAVPVIAAAIMKAAPVVLQGLALLKAGSDSLSQSQARNAGGGWEGIATGLAKDGAAADGAVMGADQANKNIQTVATVAKGLGSTATNDQRVKALQAAGVNIEQVAKQMVTVVEAALNAKGAAVHRLATANSTPQVAQTFAQAGQKLEEGQTVLAQAGVTVEDAARQAVTEGAH